MTDRNGPENPVDLSKFSMGQRIGLWAVSLVDKFLPGFTANFMALNTTGGAQTFGQRLEKLGMSPTASLQMADLAEHQARAEVGLAPIPVSHVMEAAKTAGQKGTPNAPTPPGNPPALPESTPQKRDLVAGLPQTPANSGWLSNLGNLIIPAADAHQGTPLTPSASPSPAPLSAPANQK